MKYPSDNDYHLMCEWQYKVTMGADVYKKQTEHKYNNSVWNKVHLIIESIFNPSIALMLSC
ncbi:hypothetical protein CKY06_16135 [Photorhabdus sp. S15-56]|nr:hypothetical protein CKY15_15670 [Photorhabdus sp. S7-51]RAW76280.1 hypothetical protein CKY06_16135 [Photorhabdus sp. S15-56]